MSLLLRLGTRGSPLAQAQARLAADALTAAGAEVEMVVVSTRGDAAQSTPLGELGPGAFASALEEALLADEIDVAVHSAKDLTGDELDGLVLAAFLPRADPRDAWCGEARSFGDIAVGARVGTSSLRLPISGDAGACGDAGGAAQHCARSLVWTRRLVV